ncbi:MAG: hypothetical protein WCX12_01215 [Candidatus Paceibacterota bacterium]|jgi:hypothetical protein
MKNYSKLFKVFLVAICIEAVSMFEITRYWINDGPRGIIFLISVLFLILMLVGIWLALLRKRLGILIAIISSAVALIESLISILALGFGGDAPSSYNVLLDISAIFSIGVLILGSMALAHFKKNIAENSNQIKNYSKLLKSFLIIVCIEAAAMFGLLFTVFDIIPFSIPLFILMIGGIFLTFQKYWWGIILTLIPYLFIHSSFLSNYIFSNWLSLSPGDSWPLFAVVLNFIFLPGILILGIINIINLIKEKKVAENLLPHQN